jgi:peptidoglycan hydrolase CwlO-like protein
MKRCLSALLILVLLTTLSLPLVSPVTQADELDDTTNVLSQKQADLKKAQAALQTAKSKESQLGGTLGGLQQSLDIALAQIAVKQAEVAATLAELDRRTAILKQQEQNRTDRVRTLYKQVKWGVTGELLSMLDAKNFRSWTKLLSFHQSALNDDKSRISSLDQQITQLAKERDQLQAQAKELDAKKVDLQKQADVIKSQISIVRSQKQGFNNQVVSLGNDIKGLTAKQQQLVQAKIAANAARSTVGDKDTISTPLPNPGFSPAFAFASYGYPHRVGMNQYGAYGRAKAGQGYQQILTTYYAGVAVGGTGVPDTISVQGYGTIPFEDNYLKGISEMPRNWPLEALKAQAIAARTYAIKWLQSNPGGSICTTESCQVYNGARINGTGGDDLRWYQAVAETRGIVITHGGQLINAW